LKLIAVLCLLSASSIVLLPRISNLLPPWNVYPL